jgi:hypothetical protein
MITIDTFNPNKDGHFHKQEWASKSSWLAYIDKRASNGKVSFSKANAKLKKLVDIFAEKNDDNLLAIRAREKLAEFGITTLKSSWIHQFNLPSGITCPGARKCKRWMEPWTGEIKLGPHNEWGCYSVDSESQYPLVLPFRWTNYIVLKNGLTAARMAEIIEYSLPKNSRVIRIHEAGDFWTQKYLAAWVLVAKRNPDKVFFGYSKTTWAATAEYPDNMFMQYSDGGRFDKEFSGKMPTCYVGVNDDHILQIGEPVACATKDDDWQDFARIILGESFTIPLH